MCGRILDWLVVKWQWPYATLFVASFLGVLAPLLFHFAGTPLGLVYLQLPIYMLHQYEEHAGDRFKMGQRHARPRPRGADPDRHLLDQLAVGLGLDLVALYLAVFVDLSLGLIAIYLPMLNAFGHMIPAVIKRQYNPGLATSLTLFLPVGIASAYVVSRAAGSHLDAHLLASVPRSSSTA